MAALTPKKQANKSASSNCRICKCSFAIKFGTGKLGRISTENLFETSNREGSRGTTLALMCAAVGIVINKLPYLSDRVCNSCGRKVRNLFHLFNLIKNSTKKESVQNPPRFKRLLPSSVSPSQRSPANRKVFRTGSRVTTSKPSPQRQLFASVQGQSQHQAKDNFLEKHISVSNLFESNETQVKVTIIYPSGNVAIPTLHDKQSQTLIKNIALKNWQAAANGFFSHKSLKEELPAALQRSVSSEFAEYSRSDSILKGTKPDELAGFSSKHLVEEIRIFCPLWNASVYGACGPQPRINAVALCSSVAARARNSTMSALAYRISAVLFHSGVGYDDMRRLNRMGISMSPDMMINLQRQMGKSYNSKIQVWKNTIETNMSTVEFLQEVKENQVKDCNADDMDIDTQIDLTDNSVNAYSSYTPEVLQQATKLISTTQFLRDETGITDQTVNDAIKHLESEELPIYK